MGYISIAPSDSIVPVEFNEYNEETKMESSRGRKAVQINKIPKVSWEGIKGRGRKRKESNLHSKQQKIEDMGCFDGLPKPVFRRREPEVVQLISDQERPINLKDSNSKGSKKMDYIGAVVDCEDIRESIKRWNKRESLGSLDNSERRYLANSEANSPIYVPRYSFLFV
jgi:hypothetical protein